MALAVIGHQVQRGLNNGALWAAEQINVICSPHNELGQMLHFAVDPNPLDAYNGRKSRQGQLDAFHLK